MMGESHLALEPIQSTVADGRRSGLQRGGGLLAALTHHVERTLLHLHLLPQQLPLPLRRLNI